MLGCKPADIPMESSYKESLKEKSNSVDNERYQRLIGKLIYLFHTRPDIGFAVNFVSQFMNDPKEVHQQAVYRILRYLKMTTGKGLYFKKYKGNEFFSDADWTVSITDRRSSTWYCTYVCGN